MKIVALGEIMMRLSTPVSTSVNNLTSLNTYFGGGEYNTLINLAGLGHQTKMITSLPENQLSNAILKQARSYNVNTDYVIQKSGRLGTYYTILGDEITATDVIYDRADSVFSQAKFTDFDWQECFENCDLFHVSGITPALSATTKEMTIKAIQLANSMGIKVSYDSNYRGKLWSQKEAGCFLETVLPLVDYAFLGILDMKYLLNMSVDNLETGYQLLASKYPNIKLFASTNREVETTNIHHLAVNIYTDKLYTTNTKKVNVIDRIGGGDVFTAGVLDGVLLNKSLQEIGEFALADALIKHYQIGDNMDITRTRVESVIKGTNFRINR